MYEKCKEELQKFREINSKVICLCCISLCYVKKLTTISRNFYDPLNDPVELAAKPNSQHINKGHGK